MSPSDDSTIRALWQAMERAWTAGDGNAFAAVFAEECDFTTVRGDSTPGRTGIARGHERLFRSAYRSSRLTTAVRGIRYLRPDLATVTAESRIVALDGAALADTHALAVVERTTASGERIWQIVTFHTMVPLGNAQLALTCALHPLVNEAAADRFAKGLHLDAVLRAFKAVEYRVQTLSGSTKIGEDLMGFVLGSTTPRLTVTRSTGGSLPSEQAGMRDLFKGAMTALRNPRAHGPHYADDPDEAQEMLILASFLMRRLDLAEVVLSAPGTASSVAAP
ncbi:TIGR02391 family protein [Kitasatospora sp. NPDC059599]|uniref:TIGR02391 family protein n=1 Tax=Kitasatospora sp. NPDC059599 TaxID=3346880 RepID=UPI00368D23C4